MEFRILGPLEARSEGLELPLGGPRQRALLAYLLLHANEVVSVERLIDELWFDPPMAGAAAVQTQISRLRKLVGERLMSSAHGYSLRVDVAELDLHRLRALLAEAGEAASPAERSLLLKEAEALWSGDPLAGLDAPFVSGEVAALDELRYGALEERFAADLERGCAAELLAEISLLVAQEPLRERLRMHQILALYRAGRQADALDAYRDARATLDEELGLEPSRPLKELERAILRQDPALDLSVSPPVEAVRVPVRRRRRTIALACVLGFVAMAGLGAALLLTHKPHHTAQAAGASPKSPRQVNRPHAVTSRSWAKTKTKAHPVHQAVVRVRRVVQPHPAATVTRSRPRAAPPQQKAGTTTTATMTAAPTVTVPRRPATISDTFAGTQIDSTIWYQIATGTGWTLSQRDGYVEFAFDSDAVPAGQYNQIGGHLGSQCKFPGDFDARVDFSLPRWPTRNGVIVNLWAFFSNVGYAAWRRSSPQWGELFGSYTGPNDSGGVQLDDTSGSLRLARQSGLLTAYFLHKGNWDALTSTRESGLATIAIGASAGADFGKQAVTVDLKNFTVTGDNPACPSGSRPTGS
jgi:DNA-binding SARP family transcriptional activator